MSLSQLESPVQSSLLKGHKPVLNTADQHLGIEWPWDSSAQIPYHLVIQFPCFICGIQHRLVLHATSVLTTSSGKSWPFKWPTTCVKNAQWVGGAFTAVVFSYQCTVRSSAMHCSGWRGRKNTSRCDHAQPAPLDTLLTNNMQITWHTKWRRAHVTCRPVRIDPDIRWPVNIRTGLPAYVRLVSYFGFLKFCMADEQVLQFRQMCNT